MGQIRQCNLFQNVKGSIQDCTIRYMVADRLVWKKSTVSLLMAKLGTGHRAKQRTSIYLVEGGWWALRKKASEATSAPGCWLTLCSQPCGQHLSLELRPPHGAKSQAGTPGGGRALQAQPFAFSNWANTSRFSLEKRLCKGICQPSCMKISHSSQRQPQHALQKDWHLCQGGIDMPSSHFSSLAFALARVMCLWYHTGTLKEAHVVRSQAKQNHDKSACHGSPWLFL